MSTVAGVEDPTELIELLRRVPLLNDFDSEQLTLVSQIVTTRRAAPGEVIVRQGEEAHSMFLITRGQVRVVSDVPEERVLLTRLGRGEWFGEVALLEDVPRTSAVVAEEATDLVELDRADLVELEAQQPGWLARLSAASEARKTAERRLFENEAYSLAALSPAVNRLTIGAHPDCDAVLDGPHVAAMHAEIVRIGGEWHIRACDPEAPVFVNRDQVEEAVLRDGDCITLGSRRLFLLDGVLKLFEQSRGVRIEVRDLECATKSGRVLLHQVCADIHPGEMVAIIGPSGAGKTTLLNALLGRLEPTAGEILYDGRTLSEDRTRLRMMLGYVPQHDIVHSDLKVIESLTAAGRLRLNGVSGEDLERRIAAALYAVRLEHRSDTLVSALSGGQRKRVCIAAELLSDPGILFLDEPTSGLDPGLDEQLMFQLRELADEGRTVVLTTHATRNIRTCDRVLVLQGGLLVFTGTPSQALSHFGVEDFAEIYGILDAPAEGAEAHAPPDQKPARTTIAREPVPLLSQTWHLIRRDLRVLSRDRVNMGLRLLGAPLLALLQTATFKSDIFAVQQVEGGNAQQALTLLYLSSAICLFLGAFTSANVITREDGIFRRERLVGLSPVAYVTAKVLVLGSFSLLQGIVFVLVLSLRIDFPAPVTETQMLLAGALVLTSFVGVTMGLFISALSPNADRAAILVVLALIPQLIFSGAGVPRSQMSPLSKAISELTVTKWALELEAGITDLDTRFETQGILHGAAPDGTPIRVDIPVQPYRNAFDEDVVAQWIVLAGFAVVFTAGTLVVQQRKRP